MSEQIKLATFRINGDRWAEFVNRAAARNTNASSLLKQFIDRYLSGIDGIDGIDLKAIAPSHDIEQLLDQALAPIRQEVKELREQLVSLAILQNQPQEPEVQGSTRRSKDTPIAAEPSEGKEVGGGRLSLTEAYQLAKGRGYTGAATSIRRDAVGGKLEAFGLAIVQDSERMIGPGVKNYVELVKE